MGFSSKLQQIGNDMSEMRKLLSEELNEIKEMIDGLKGGNLKTEENQAISKIYDIESVLGSGISGMVVLVRDVQTDRLYARKDIQLKDSLLTPSLTREISTLFEINHANIVKLEKVYLTPNELHLLMQYGGEDLNIYLQLNAPLDSNIMKTWLRQLLTAVDFLHKKDIVHRDLKPENILIDTSQNLRITDFGSARRIFENTKLSPKVTTLSFRAPEVLLGSHVYGKPIDVWAIGCIFAEMALGESLFDSTTEMAMLKEIFKKLGTPSRESGLYAMPNFPTDLEVYPEASDIISDPIANDLLKKLLSVDPLQRITAEDALNHPYLSEREVVGSVET